MPIRRRERKHERGAAALEFALVMPLLITLIFGAIDFGWAINRYTVINNGAREGVRVASLGGTSAQIEAAVVASMDTTLQGTPTVVVTCLKPPPNATAACVGTYDSARAQGGTAIVTVSTSQDWLTPLMSTFSAKLNLTKASRMRIE